MPTRYGAKINNKVPEAIKKIEKGMEKNLLAAVMEWHGGIMDVLSGNRTGREYFVPGTGGVGLGPVIVRPKHPRYKVSEFTRISRIRTGTTYTASRAGEAPASRLGDLRRRYKFRVVNGVGEVGNPLQYALYLEKGTKRMKPRPHVITAFREREAKIKAALGRGIT